MGNITGAQLAIEALEARGIKRIFTLSGGHITPLYQYVEKTDIELFDTRHEQAAGFMAEATGRMTRKAATVMVTAGPGFTNVLTAVQSANLANAPMVVIAGCVGLETKDKLDLQDMNQLPVIQPMVKKAMICHTPERIPEYIDIAYRTAESGRPGPVYLELPVDILNAAVNEEKIIRTSTSINSKPVDLNGAKELVALIKKAKKPIIVGGSGTYYSQSEDELKEFIENTGIPLYTFAMGRGVVSDTHPLCFESSLAIRPGSAMLASISSDLVIILGSRLDLFNIYGGIFNPNAKMVQVDILPEEIGRNRSIDLPVVSDISEFLKECNRIVKKEKNSKELTAQFSDWVSELSKATEEAKNLAMLNWKKEGTPIHPLRLAKEVDDYMNKEDDIVIADGGDTTTWIGMTRIMRQSGHYLDYGLYGSLAVGLPFANAAKLLYPKSRVILLGGDGSIGFNFMEFETAIRKKLPIVVIISNDLGWGMIRHSQEIRLGHSIDDGTLIGRVDYHKMVEAIGGFGKLVEKPEDILPAIEEAFASGKTACINVMTDTTTVSPGSVALANLGGYKA